MAAVRSLAPVLAAIAAVALGAGCGLGPGDSSDGEATLTVTRDYGAEPVLEATRSDPPETETVMRMLDREADIETRYGGGFVEAIEGIEGSFEDGRSFDWFFYVNGVESEIGAAEASVRGGDRIWWDHRDWTEAMRVPAVVGSWPEPFLQATAGSERVAVRVVCASDMSPCEAAQDALAGAGVSSDVTRLKKNEPKASLRLVVGAWDEIRSDETAALIARGPASSGVFARIDDGAFTLLDEQGDEAGTANGLLAATRNGGGPPTWIATGTHPESVADAVSLLDEDTLSDRYAVAVSDGEAVPLPVDERGPG